MVLANQILAAVTRGLLGSVEGRALDRAELLGKAGLSEAAIADADAWVPIDLHVRLGRAITSSLPHENLGLQTGLRIFGDPKGALGFVLRRSDYHFRALENFCSYLGVVNHSMVVELSLQAPEAKMTLHMVPALAELGHPAEALLAAWVGISRHLTNAAWSPVRIDFTHRAHGNVQEHADFFQCPVNFDASCTRMVLPAEAWSLAIEKTPHALEPALLLARDRARELLSHDGHASRMLDVVFTALTTTPLDVRTAVPEHTPSTREARLALAHGLLEHSSLFVHEIVYLLGFEDPRAFEHSFTALYGKAPREARSRA